MTITDLKEEFEIVKIAKAGKYEELWVKEAKHNLPGLIYKIASKIQPSDLYIATGHMQPLPIVAKNLFLGIPDVPIVNMEIENKRR